MSVDMVDNKDFRKIITSLENTGHFSKHVQAIIGSTQLNRKLEATGI